MRNYREGLQGPTFDILLSPDTDLKTVLERVKQYGAVRLSEFIPSDQQEAILSSINPTVLEKIDERTGTVHTYDKVEYKLDDSCPLAILDLGRKMLLFEDLKNFLWSRSSLMIKL